MVLHRRSNAGIAWVSAPGDYANFNSNHTPDGTASYPPVQYIPRRDVDMAALTRSEHTTYCPYKGDASYYSIPAGGDRSLNAVWSYETPFEAMAQIKDYVAFYSDRVDEIR